MTHSSEIKRTNKLNILVFLTDDHGSWANGCYGDRNVNTPSIDYLAATGVRFENAFTPCPVCSPARASFWTGKIPSAHGIHDHIGDSEHPGITGQKTLAQCLKEAGYYTGLSGKWHGHAYGQNPQPGFDFWFSQWFGTNAKFGPQPFSRNGEREEYHGHQSPLIADSAIQFLHEHKQSDSSAPFFLFVGFTDTHSPFSTLPERLVQKYRNTSLNAIENEPFSSIHGEDVTASPNDEAGWREQLAQYYASVELIDEQVGRVLDVLEGIGELDNTVIVYTSDHGHMNGQHGLLTKGNATIPQNFLEESIRVPLVVRHPHSTTRGQTFNFMVDHTDLYATLRETAGMEPRPELPGVSYLPFLESSDESSAISWRSNQFCEYGNARMIRTDEGFKLIRRYPGPNGHFQDELYNLQIDPQERQNFIADPEYASLVNQLDGEMDSFFNTFESSDCSGRNIARLRSWNVIEPWRREWNGDLDHILVG